MHKPQQQSFFIICVYAEKNEHKIHTSKNNVTVKKSNALLSKFYTTSTVGFHLQKMFKQFS